MAVGATVGTRVGVGVAAGGIVGALVDVGAVGASADAPVDVGSVEQARTRRSMAAVARYLPALQIRGAAVMVSAASFKSGIPLSTTHSGQPQVWRIAGTRWQKS